MRGRARLGVVGPRLERQASLPGRRRELVERETGARSRPRGRAGRGRRSRARSRRSRPPPAGPGGCRRFPAARRSRGRVAGRAAASGGAGSRSQRGRPPANRRARVAPTSASLGSSRPGTPTSASPSGSSPGRSLAECTPIATRPSSNALSIPLTNRALSPTSPSAVLIGLDLDPPERRGDPLRLDPRQRAAARAQPEAHLPRRRRRSPRSETSAPPASRGSLSRSSPKSSRSTATFA